MEQCEFDCRVLAQLTALSRILRLLGYRCQEQIQSFLNRVAHQTRKPQIVTSRQEITLGVMENYQLEKQKKQKFQQF